MSAIKEDVETFSYLKLVKGPNEHIFTMTNRQTGIFRTNCMDCLDRTNHI